MIITRESETLMQNIRQGLYVIGIISNMKSILYQRNEFSILSKFFQNFDHPREHLKGKKY